MRAAVHRDVTLPCSPSRSFVEHRDLAGSLHNPTEAASDITEIRQGSAQAALVQAALLGAVGAVDNPGGSGAGQVHRRRLVSSR